MNKLFLIGVLATGMLASCSSDEQVDVPASQNAITFKSFVNKSTRATDLANDNITNFSVFGYIDNATGVLFNNEAVTGSGTGEGANWTYANTQYWTPSRDYYFTAIAPTTDANWTFAPLTGTENYGEGGVITFTNNGTQDLLYAYNRVRTPATITATDPGAVPLTFNHLLSRVKFNFTNSMGNDNTTLVIKSVKITDANTKATMDVGFTAKRWTLAEDNTTAVLDFGDIEGNIANAASKDTDHLYLISQNQTYTMTFVVEMWHGGVLANTFSHTGEYAVTMPQVEMLPGYSYLFKAELNGNNIDPEKPLEPIVFTVQSVEEWEAWKTNTHEGSIVPTE